MTQNEGPQRHKTDGSLAFERNKTDDELMRRTRADEEKASAVVDTARKRAADVLTRVRDAAEEKLRSSGTSDDNVVARQNEHAHEDATLAREQATADETLVTERDVRRLRLTALLALEREHTDQNLVDERRRSDAAIRSRDDFLAMASHDLRNMVGVIAMSASSLLAKRDDAVHAAVERDAHRIHRYTTRMARLIGDLLDIVSIDAGRLAIEPSRHDVMDLIRETEDAFRPLAADKRISFSADVKNGSVIARYDDERILQVLGNLLGNALKFTPDGGRIDLRVEPLDDEVRFVVSDTGPGIASDKLEAIFERFWQASPKSVRTGLGLGLHISKCIVEAHGGKIWAESHAGEGATVSFTLPKITEP
jgi:signal transduction histidine kinase